MTFLTILWVTEILSSFGLVIEAKTGKEIPVSSRLEFLEKFLANNLVKPVENKSKNLQSFLEVSLVQKEVLLSHKLQDHAYEY